MTDTITHHNCNDIFRLSAKLCIKRFNIICIWVINDKDNIQTSILILENAGQSARTASLPIHRTGCMSGHL